jgi:hypothetical protein
MEVNLFDHSISDLQICAGDPLAKKDTCEVGVILPNWQNLYFIIFNKLGQLITYNIQYTTVQKYSTY